MDPIMEAVLVEWSDELEDAFDDMDYEEVKDVIT